MTNDLNRMQHKLQHFILGLCECYYCGYLYDTGLWLLARKPIFFFYCIFFRRQQLIGRVPESSAHICCCCVSSAVQTVKSIQPLLLFPLCEIVPSRQTNMPPAGAHPFSPSL